MNSEMKLKRLLIIVVCSLTIMISWIIWSLVKDVRLTNFSSLNEISKNDSEWSRYQLIREKILTLNRGWKRPLKPSDSNGGLDVDVPINNAITVQIKEINRIYEEEILGKLSEANRIYQEYQQNLQRESEIKEAEKIRVAKIKLESDLDYEAKKSRQTLVNYYQDLERKEQYSLINLELQKKMFVFSSNDLNIQQTENERIDSQITRIRNEIKRKFDERNSDLNKELELYQKQRNIEYREEIRDFHNVLTKEIQTELSRFREEQMKEFNTWNGQRRIEVERAVELRRSQQ